MNGGREMQGLCKENKYWWEPRRGAAPVTRLRIWALSCRAAGIPEGVEQCAVMSSELYSRLLVNQAAP